MIFPFLKQINRGIRMINEIADQLNRIIEALASDLYHTPGGIPGGPGFVSVRS